MSKSERRRRRKAARASKIAARAPRSLVSSQEREAPPSASNRKPSTALLALLNAGLIERHHVETGDMFHRRWRVAALHAPSVTPRYGAVVGSEPDEAAQQQARQWVSARLQRLRPETARVLIDVVALEVQSALTLAEAGRLRDALSNLG